MPEAPSVRLPCDAIVFKLREGLQSLLRRQPGSSLRLKQSPIKGAQIDARFRCDGSADRQVRHPRLAPCRLLKTREISVNRQGLPSSPIHDCVDLWAKRGKDSASHPLPHPVQLDQRTKGLVGIYHLQSDPNGRFHFPRLVVLLEARQNPAALPTDNQHNVCMGRRCLAETGNHLVV